jgi:hypothetical protein
MLAAFGARGKGRFPEHPPVAAGSRQDEGV